MAAIPTIYRCINLRYSSLPLTFQDFVAPPLPRKKINISLPLTSSKYHYQPITLLNTLYLVFLWHFACMTVLVKYVINNNNNNNNNYYYYY